MKPFSNALPENLKPLFWSYNFENLDREKDKRLIVIQIINYGNWSQWKWLVDNYRREEVKRIIESIPAASFRLGAFKLISSLLTIKKLSDAPRGSR